MANVNNFRGILVYTQERDENGKRFNYLPSEITKIAGSGTSNIKDYVILDNADTDYDVIANQILTVAKQIYDKKSAARLWLATPSYSSSNPLTYDKIKTYLTKLKTKFMNDSGGREVWKNAVYGIYMNMESIYNTVDYSSSSSLLKNASIKVANDVSYYVHNNLQNEVESISSRKLDFLWIPYYGYNDIAATTIKNIGYVVSRTTIFDIVIIQPAYYHYYTGSIGNYKEKSESDNVLIKNLDGVAASIKNGTNKGCVCYRDKNPVIARESYATATVGFEMEIDNMEEPSKADFIVPPKYNRAKKNERYESYRNTFESKRKSDIPMCFYAGNKSVLTNNIEKIKDFYNF